jgi:hypothetical protein
MTNALYLVKYTGNQGIGSVVLALLNGQVFGVDVAGGEYSGNYKEENGKIVGEITLLVPAGVALVTGAPISPEPYTVPIPVTLPIEINEQQTVQIQVQLPTGLVNANVKKVKNIP